MTGMNNSYNAFNEAQLTYLLAIKSNGELPRETLMQSWTISNPLIDNDRVRALLILKIILNFGVKNTQNCRFCDVIF